MKKNTIEVTKQQDLLRQAMKALNMTRSEFAVRIGTPLRALKNWLLPDTSKGHREMPNSLRILIREILKKRSTR